MGVTSMTSSLSSSLNPSRRKQVRTLSCLILSYRVLSCLIMSSHVMSCYDMMCYVMLCHVMLCYVMIYYVMLGHHLHNDTVRVYSILPFRFMRVLHNMS